MQPTACGALGFVMTLLLAACTSGGSTAVPTVSTGTSSSTSIVTVTTTDPAPGSNSSATADSQPTTTEPSPPTLVIPNRPVGLESLDLTAADLVGISVLNPVVEEVFPHDRTAVTEGLAFASADQLLESTGFYGRSTRRVIDLGERTLDPVVSLAPEVYATGILVDPSATGEGLQFSRLEERVQRFDLATLDVIDERRFEGEVNGACAISAQELALSTADGDIVVVSTDSLTPVRSVSPAAGDSRLPPLGDLSCVDGAAWGIVGTSTVIAEIDLASGAVTTLADLSELTPAGLAGTDLLSGLAFRPTSDTWFVTGKRWDVLYEISLAP